MPDNFLVSIDDDGTIDDNIILAVDKTGDELLRFGIPIQGKWVKCRYPRWGQWQLYQINIKKIFMIFGAECDNINLSEEALGNALIVRGAIKQWALIQAAIQVQKGLVDLIDKTFFDYLNPSVDGIEPENVRQWIYDNAPITLPFLFFAALLHPEQWAKKKALQILEETFQTWTRPISADIYTPNTAGASLPLPIAQPFELA